MSVSIRDVIKPWGDADRRVGEQVHDLVLPRLRDILLSAYRQVDASMPAVPDDLYAAEKAKFGFIARGDFSDDYFALQSQLAENIASMTDYATYLRGYAVYCGKMVAELLDASQDETAENRNRMAESAIASVFADLTVTMGEYFRKEAEEDARARAVLGKALNALADRDLTYRVGDDAPAKIADARADFNAATESLESTMTGIAGSTEEVSGSVSEIARAISELADRTEEQARMLEQTVSSVDQVSDAMRTNADTARRANGAAAEATTLVGRSGEVMAQANTAMGAISNSSREIEKIVSVIDEISMQTNLLALNAAVEAARAGDAGSGFAVVAQEVRQLAQRTAENARNIRDLIETSSDHVGRGEKVLKEVGVTLDSTSERVKEINGLMADIANRTETQATAFGRINESVTNIETLTQRNAAMAEETHAAVVGLDGSSARLGDMVGQFRLSDATWPDEGDMKAKAG